MAQQYAHALAQLHLMLRDHDQSTGTCTVPGLDFRAGDVVEIAVDGVGALSNPVGADQAELYWLVEAIDQPLVRGAHRARAQGEA